MCPDPRTTRARLRDAALGAAAPWLLWLLVWHAPEDGLVVRADFGASAYYFVVVSIIGGIASWFRGRVNEGTRTALNGLRSALTQLGAELVKGLGTAARYIAKALGVVKRLLQRIFVPLFRALVNGFARFGVWLRKLFKPILDWLIKVRGHILDFYTRFVRPVLDAIDLARRVLRLLGYLGIDWARALDQKLGQLAGFIRLPFEWAIRKINEIIAVVNRIVTLDGLLQRLTLMRSLIRDVRLTTNLLHNYQTVDLSPGEIAALNLRHASPHPEVIDDDLAQYLESQGGPMRAKIEEMIAETVLIGENRRVISGEE